MAVGGTTLRRCADTALYWLTTRSEFQSSNRVILASLSSAYASATTRRGAGAFAHDLVELGQGLDCSPKGDRPGFVQVEDDGRTLLIPDRRLQVEKTISGAFRAARSILPIARCPRGLAPWLYPLLDSFEAV